jgi:hypothetical protein
MSSRLWVAAGIVVSAVLSTLANFFPWPVAVLLGLGAGVLTLAATLWLQPRAGVVDLAVLADRIREQWKAELQSRGISLAAPLAVRWTATDRAVSAPAANIVGGIVGGRPVRLRVRGDLHDLAAKFRALPHRQLVILGEPGAGKTVLAVFLALDLLTGESPVPVVLPLSSWDVDEPLYDWAADRLGRDYPKVGSAKAWRRLLASGQLLPILDGLDEVPDTHRTPALFEINTATDGGNPFVLTCRAEEYEKLIRDSGSTLTSALVVELSPVTPKQVITYLRRPGQEARWAPVVAALRAGGPLAEVLSLPFVASLARFSFARPDTDPADLCALDDAKAIRTRLLAAFLPAAYSPRPHPDLGITNKPAYATAQATMWLSFLARHMTRLGTVELAWWRLHEMLSGWRRIALRLFLPAVPLAALAGYAVGVLVDRKTGLNLPPALFALLGLATGLAVPIRPRRPGWVDPAVDEKATKLRKRVSAVAFLVLCTLPGIYLLNLDPTVYNSRAPYPVPDYAASGRQVTELFVLVLLAPVASIFLGWSVYALRVRTRLSSRALPTLADSLAADRKFVASIATVYVYLGVISLFLVPIALTGRPVPDQVYWLLVLATIASLFAWHASPSFSITARLLRGKLPRRLLPFLEDAHSRGILRQVGTVYQFRHAMLQQYLADSAR